MERQGCRLVRRLEPWQRMRPSVAGHASTSLRRWLQASAHCRGGDRLGAFFKTNPNGGPVQIRKTAFFTGRRTFHFQSNLRDETCFYETNPNKEKCEPASIDCKSVTCMKTLWRRVTVPGAKRTQMKPWKELDQSKEPRRRGCPLNTRKTRKRGSTGVGETATESYPQNAREEEAVCMRATVVVGRDRRARRIVVSAGPAACHVSRGPALPFGSQRPPQQQTCNKLGQNESDSIRLNPGCLDQ